MARRMIDWTRGGEPADDGRPTRAERRSAGRAEADEAGALADALVALDEVALAQVPLDDDLGACLHETRAMRPSPGRRRQLRRLAALLRDADRAPIQAALRRIEAGRAAVAEDFHQWERWRERLLGGEAEVALADLVAQFPRADAGRIARLAEEARAERADGGPPRAFRALFKALRALER